MSFGLFIISPVTQSETFWNNALDGKIFTVLSRLTFQVYLIHWTVINWIAGETRSLWYLSEGNLAFIYLQVLLISFPLAFVAYLTIEAPFGELVSLWMKNGKKQPRKLEPKRRISRQEDTDGTSDHDEQDSDEETHLLKSKTA
jgi:peptidoglycan/LPS O-acetylase OafA/YrhL